MSESGAGARLAGPLIVRLALAASVVIYAGIALGLGWAGALPIAGPQPEALGAILIAVAGLLALASFALPRLAAGGRDRGARSAASGGPAASGGRSFAECLVAWAMSEAVAVIGLAHHLLFARPVVTGLLMGAGLALLFVHRPPDGAGWLAGGTE